VLILCTLGMLAISATGWAADYKDWIPCFPDHLDGLKAESKGAGMNMNSNGGSMSTFNISYGSGDKGISINITHSQKDPDQAENKKPEPPVEMEMGGVLMKTVKIQGFDAFYQYVKDEHIATISLRFKTNTTFILTSSIAKGEKHDIGLFSNIDLKRIYASL